MISDNIFGLNDATSLSELRSAIGSILRESHTSLSTFIKPALITAPVFIQQSISNDQVISNVHKALFNMYASYILVALKLDGIVSGSTTVRDVIKRVSSTESSSDVYIPMETLDKLVLSLSSNDKITKKQLVSAIEGVLSDETSAIQRMEGITAKYLTGRILNIALSVPNKRESISIHLYCQFFNRIIMDSLIRKFIEAVNTDKKYRFTMWRAGEISFFKDLVLGLDLYKKKLDITKYDNEGIFLDMMKRHNVGLAKKIIDYFTGDISTTNVKNNIYIIEDNTFKSVCSAVGLNFKRMNHVQQILRNTRSIFFASVNTLNQVVTFYIYGINNPFMFTYKELMSSGLGKSNQTDIVTILEMFKKGVV